MRCTNGLPDKHTVGYTLLELVAVSGELPADQLCRLPGGDSYKLNVVRVLKSQKLLRTYYRDGVRGYRLTAPAKKALCRDAPNPDTPVLVYCRTGRRAEYAGEALADSGYRHVFNFLGVTQWPYELVR